MVIVIIALCYKVCQWSWFHSRYCIVLVTTASGGPKNVIATNTEHGAPQRHMSQAKPNIKHNRFNKMNHLIIFNNIIPHPKGNLQKFMRCSSNPCFFFWGFHLKIHQKSQQLRATPQPSHIFRACSTSSAFLAALAMSFAAVTASASWPSSWENSHDFRKPPEFYYIRLYHYLSVHSFSVITNVSICFFFVCKHVIGYRYVGIAVRSRD